MQIFCIIKGRVSTVLTPKSRTWWRAWALFLCSKRKALIGHKSVGDLQEPGTIQFCSGYTYKAKDDLYGKNYYLWKQFMFTNLYGMVWHSVMRELIVQVHSSSKDCGSDSGHFELQVICAYLSRQNLQGRNGSRAYEKKSINKST